MSGECPSRAAATYSCKDHFSFDLSVSISLPRSLSAGPRAGRRAARGRAARRRAAPPPPPAAAARAGWALRAERSPRGGLRAPLTPER